MSIWYQSINIQYFKILGDLIPCQVGIRAILGDSSPVFCSFSTVFPIELFFL